MLKDLLAQSAKQLEELTKYGDDTNTTVERSKLKAHHLAQISSAFALGEQSGIKKAVEVIRKTAQNHNHSAGCGEVCKAFSEVVEALQSNLTTHKD